MMRKKTRRTKAVRHIRGMVVHDWSSLQSIGQEDKLALRKAFARCAYFEYKHKLQKSRCRAVLLTGTGLFMLALLVQLCISYLYSYVNSLSLVVGLLVWLVFISIFVKMLNSIFRLLLVLIISLAAAALSPLCFRTHIEIYCGVLVTVAALNIYTIIVGLIAVYAVVSLLAVFDRMYERAHPEPAFVLCLSRALLRLERGGAKWHDLEERSHTIHDLDRAALLVRTCLFHKVRSTNLEVQRWQNERSKKIANALLEKQYWVTTPMANTREQLISRLSSMLLATLKGTWDSYELYEKDISEPPAEGVLKRTWRAIQILLIALGPVAIFFLMVHYTAPNYFSEDELKYMRIGLMLWVAVSLLPKVDPQFAEKISMIKSFVRGGEKKEKD